MKKRKSRAEKKTNDTGPTGEPGAARPASGSRADDAHFPIVGIGASAGGLAALKRLFQAMPADTGMAFVVILHLDPDHTSHMTELLAQATAMDVVAVVDGMPASPDRVHVIPPNAALVIDQGVLHVREPRPRATRFPIDEFFASLAHDRHECAIGVVLTGTGSDGSRGIRDIKAEGGLLVAQLPAEAEYDAMPRNAVATGLVDLQLKIDDIPAAIVDYVKHAGIHRHGALSEGDQDLKQLLALVKARGDFDFRWYKRATVLRRVRRRMGLTRCPTLAAYIERLRSDAGEVSQLVSDLLIGVTAFFREPEAWSCLRSEVLTRLVAEGDPDTPIRVWVPACSTGEEAYTLTMLLLEELETQHSERRLQVFATDVDDRSLDRARAGLYSPRVVASIEPQRLKRFFSEEADGFRVSKQLRDCIVFAQQNLIGDSPFSRLDLVSCRNLLIYLEPLQQDRVMSVFHFVLKENGYLFLGSSETVGKHTAMFRVVSKKWRIYRRLGASRRPPADLPAARGSAGEDRLRIMQALPTRRAGASELARSMLLEFCSPTAVLVDRNGEVLYFHGRTEDYLSQPQGEPTVSLLDLARRGLRSRLRAALHRANLKRERVVMNDVRVQRADKTVPVRISVLPWSVSTDAELGDLALVTFEDVPSSVNTAGAVTITDGDSAAVAQLEDELKRTKEELQSTIEELEAANEELKVSNEEAMSMNEELQSTNEELETSKEELQSLNEELSTINSQLEDKLVELQSTTDDLDNLLTSTNLATLFLDHDFRVKRFTPPITKLMRLIESDVGRHVQDITSQVDQGSLLQDAVKVLEDLRPVEREVSAGDVWYLRRILPYRTRQHHIEGVVVTFTDISDARRRAEENAHLAAVVSASEDAIISKDLNGTVLSWNRAAERMYGYSAREVIGNSISTIVPPDRMGEFQDLMRNLRRGKHVRRIETDRLSKSGQRIEVALSISPVRGPDGKVSFFSGVERDITAFKAAQREVQRLNRDLQLRLDELQTLIDAAPVGISIALDNECRTITSNAAGAEMLGAEPGGNISLSASGAPATSYEVYMDGVRVEPSALPMQRAARDGVDVRNASLELRFPDGHKLDILMNASPLLNVDGSPRGAVGVYMNIAERRRAEEQLLQNEARLREQAAQLLDADRRKDTFLAVLGHELRNPLAPIRNVIDLLHERAKIDEPTLRKALDVIDRQVRQLTRLVDDLLDVARITHDDMRLQRERIELVALCDRVVEDMGSLFARRSQTLRYTPSPDGVYVDADAVRVEQIVCNLLQNASNYTPEGGNVWLSLSEEAGQAVITVRDDGVGIAVQDQQEIFDPFSHTATSLAHSGKTGLGLGLALAHRLVHMHGGSIEVYSEGTGHGSEFTVRLPSAAKEELRPADRLSAPAQGKPTRRRIMLVEDNADVSDALSTLLTALGHEVRTVATGSAALPCASEFQPEIAFIDIGLPDIDGYEVARRLRADANTGSALLIALSGYGQQPDAARGGPFDEYLLKPLSFDRIGEILARPS